MGTKQFWDGLGRCKNNNEPLLGLLAFRDIHVALDFKSGTYTKYNLRLLRRPTEKVMKPP